MDKTTIDKTTLKVMEEEEAYSEIVQQRHCLYLYHVLYNHRTCSVSWSFIKLPSVRCVAFGSLSAIHCCHGFFFFFSHDFQLTHFFFCSLFDIGFIGRACAARGRDFGCGSRDEWRSRPRGERETG